MWYLEELFSRLKLSLLVKLDRFFAFDPNRGDGREKPIRRRSGSDLSLAEDQEQRLTAKKAGRVSATQASLAPAPQVNSEPSTSSIDLSKLEVISVHPYLQFGSSGEPNCENHI
jgi:hypothetical protein